MKLIITADDYTAADCIDKGIELALSKGCINTVSAMVNNENSVEKIKMLKLKFPDVAIGLHLTITSGKPVLPPSETETLIRGNGDNRFMNIEEFDYYRVNLRELGLELEKQIETFKATGVELDHISCHHGILTIFEDFFKVLMSLAIANNVPIRNPILISRQKMSGFRWSVMKREGLSKAFKLIDDVGLNRILRTAQDTKPRILAKRMLKYNYGHTQCPDFFIDTFYGKASKGRLKKILKNITKGSLSELVVHLADNSECTNLPNGINKKYIKTRHRELKTLIKVNSKDYIKSHSFLNWGKYSEAKRVVENSFFQY
jgi:predicted glycoside hydrolase/deacetylase ChbG (UPF0249 family)